MNWTRSEFLDKVEELSDEGLIDRDISKTLGMNIDDFRNLYCYFKHFHDDKYVFAIIKYIEEKIDMRGAVVVGRGLYREWDSDQCVRMAIAVLKNKGYKEWVGRICFDGDEDADNQKSEKVLRVLAPQRYKQVDILNFISREGWYSKEDTADIEV